MTFRKSRRQASDADVAASLAGSSTSVEFRNLVLHRGRRLARTLALLELVCLTGVTGLDVGDHCFFVSDPTRDTEIARALETARRREGATEISTVTIRPKYTELAANGHCNKEGVVSASTILVRGLCAARTCKTETGELGMGQRREAVTDLGPARQPGSSH